MRVVCLASSSAGNCYFLQLQNGGRQTTIMVECGIPAKEIAAKATENGISVSAVEACLITHYHGDHSKAVRDVSRWGMRIYASEETLSHCGAKGCVLEPLKPTSVADGVKVMAFPVKHDAEGSLGFVIKTRDECVIFVNDCKYWEANLANFKPDYVFIECNYWEKQVYAEINQMRKDLSSGSLDGGDEITTRGLIKQYERNVNAHMSLAGCIRSLAKLDLSRCRAIFLMHLSDGNANEYEMKTAVQRATGVKTLVCQKKGGIK